MAFGSSLPIELIEHRFAVSLAPNYNEGSTFAVLAYSKGRVVKVSKIKRKDFIAQAAGFYSSHANFDGKNLFEEHDVSNCSWQFDSINNVNKPMCPVSLQLWKLRYQTKPGDVKKENTTLEGNSGGWAGKEFAPDDRQRQILSRYGIIHLNDFAEGPKAFQLLKDMQDPSWISNYR